MTEVTIRKIELADLSNGFLESLDSLRKASELDPKKAQEILTDIKSKSNHVIYVAVLDSLIVGSATIFLEQKFIHNGGKVGHIEDVVVRKDYQRKRIGEKLVNALLEYAKKNGCYKTILSASDDVVPFYEKLGFNLHSNEMRYDH